MRSVFAAIAGLFLGGLLLLALGIGWDLVDGMWRERLFQTSLNAVLMGGIIGLLLIKLAGRRPLLPFAVGLLAALVFAGPFAIGFALALVAISLRPAAAAPWQRAFLPLGILSILALPLSLLLPVNQAPIKALPLPPLTAAIGTGAEIRVSEQTPDVLLIVVDTLRADAILDPAVPTPHLDALRARGLWAEAALSPANQTLPSHLALLMGLDILKIGMRGNLSRWPTAKQLETEWEARSLAARMADRGYRTAAVTTNPLLHLVPEGQGYQDFEDGFQTWAPILQDPEWRHFMDWARHRTLLSVLVPRLGFVLGHLLNPNDLRNFREHVGEATETTDRSLVYLEGLQQDQQPYFLLSQYFDPHSPYVALPPFAGTLATAELAPDGYDDGYTSDYQMRIGMRDALKNGATFDSQADISRFQNLLYDQEVAYFDSQLGRLLEAVAAGGRPTLIVFTADHGEGFGRHGNVEHGESLHEEEILVPMIFAGVGVSPGKMEGVPDLVDAAFTILARTGAVTERVDGVDLLQLPTTADGFGRQVPPQVQLSVRLNEVTIREDGWKLIAEMRYAHEELENGEVGREMPVRGEFSLRPLHLYYLPVDPQEEEDLLTAAQAAPNTEATPRLAGLLSLLKARLQDDFYPDLPERTLSPKERAQMEQLGYVGDT